MKRRCIGALLVGLVYGLLLWVSSAQAQTPGQSRLEIRLRASDGAAVAGEPVILERLPEEAPVLPACVTGAQGECTWHVQRGLYQLLFSRPLDHISALAVAEGGLRGLGVTVGDADITYHFTFHSDGRVYFDAAPEAAVPAPLIPAGDSLHGGTVASTPHPPTSEGVAVTATLPTEANAPDNAPATITARSTGPLLLFIGGGLVLGGGLHLWSRRRQRPEKQARNTEKESGDA